MEEEEDEEGSEGADGGGGGEEGGAVGAEHEGVVGEGNDGEDEQDHDGSEAPQRRAELEDVPGHHGSRSVHRFAPSVARSLGRWVGGYGMM